MGACHTELVRLADAGVVSPLVSGRVALAEVPDALQRLGDGDTVGRVTYVAEPAQ